MASAAEYMSEIVKGLVEQVCQARADSDGWQEKVIALEKEKEQQKDGKVTPIK